MSCTKGLPSRADDDDSTNVVFTAHVPAIRVD